LKKNIQGGFVLKEQHPDLKNCMLFGITEVHTDEDIDKYIKILKEIC
jgi:glycine cleavage system pyridoxal-binding protein P